MDKFQEKDFFCPPFLQVDFQVTEQCNGKCIFCPYGKKENTSEGEIRAEDWLNCLRQLKELTQVEFVCIGGGEPFLYKDVFEVIKGISALNIDSVMVTNGSLLTDDNCRKVVDSNLNLLNISLDAFSGTHDKMRGIVGLFDRCVEGIHRLKDMNSNTRVGLSVFICEKNIVELQDFIPWCLESLPIDSIFFQAYNQVVEYRGANWWLQDPLWPKDEKIITDCIEFLKKLIGKDPRIGNDPRQLDKFREYFINSDKNIGIKCAAGSFNFPVSYEGNIQGCMIDAPLGNICTDSMRSVIKNVFPELRKRADGCIENCHFLVNCYFPLNWKRWRELTDSMVFDVEKHDIENNELGKPLSSGPLFFAPEVKKALDDLNHNEYEYLIESADYVQYERVKEDFANLNKRVIPSYLSHHIVQCVFLCGDTSESHRWGVDLNENDFFHQVLSIKHFHANQINSHIVVGIRRTNFFKLQKICNLVFDVRKIEGIGIDAFPLFPLGNIRSRFDEYVVGLNEKTLPVGLELLVVDNELYDLLHALSQAPQKSFFNQNDLLRALGPVSKDIFIGPKYLLIDISGHCNLDCVYCRRFSPWVDKANLDFSKNFLEYDVVEKCLVAAKEIGVETILLVGGSEPTLHPDFGAIAGKIEDLGLKFNLSTNGSFLGKHVDSFVSGVLDTITISLSFSSFDSYKKLRPNSSYEDMLRIEQGVKALTDRKNYLKQKYPTVIGLYVISKYNYTEVLEMYSHARNLGVDNIWFQLVHLEDFSRDKLALTDEEYQHVCNDLKKVKQLSVKDGIHFESFIDFEIKHYDKKNCDWSSGGLLEQGCFVGWYMSFVYLWKEMSMCCGTKMIGFVNEANSLKDVWHSDVFKRIRNDGLIMHKENPITFFGQPLYSKYCDSCDNHNFNVEIMNLLHRYDIFKFVER